MHKMCCRRHMYMTPQVHGEEGEAEAVVAVHRRLQLQAVAAGRGAGRRGRADRDGAAAQWKHSVILLLTKCVPVPITVCGEVKYRVEQKKFLLSSVTHVPSGLICCALAA